MNKPMRVLFVEDSENDVILMLRHLENAGHKIESERIQTMEAVKSALEKKWDIILCDYFLPECTGLDVIQILRKSGYDIPIILVSGKMGEDTAVEAMRLGANDYLMKNNLTRLVPAIERELNEAEIRREKKQAQAALWESQQKYRLVVDNANEGIVIVQDDLVKFANPKIAQVAGYPIEELMSRPSGEFIHPDDREKVQEYRRRRFEGKVPGGEINEFRIIARSGNVCSIENNGVIINWEGHPATLNFLSDVTDRKAAEMAVHESEKRFALFMNYLPGSAYVKDEQGRLLFINSYFEKSTGRKSDDILWKTDSELWPRETAERFREEDMAVLKAMKPIEKIEEISIDGRIQSLLTVKFPIPRENQPPLLGGISIDITERVEAEKALRESEERFAQFMNHFPGPANIKEIDGTLVYLNENARRLYGRPTGELIGRKFSEIAPFESETAGTIESMERRIAENEETHEAVLNYAVNGDEVIYLTVKFPIHRQDRPILIGTVLLDVTDRVLMEKALLEREKQLKQAQEIGRMGSWEIDVAAQKLTWSDEMFRLFGRDPSLGAPPVEEAAALFAPEDRKRGEEGIQRAIQFGEEFEYDCRLILHGGREVYHHAVITPVKGPDGKVFKLTGIARDITARKLSEIELAESARQLEIERGALEKKNIALREILDQIEKEKNILKQQFVTNVEKAILPTLIRLQELAPPSQKRNFEMLRKDLQEIVSPFIDTVRSRYTNLSPRELEICRLIKNGLTSKEIAETLNLSPMTIQKYRELIRKKLGLTNEDTNLNTFLQSML